MTRRVDSAAELPLIRWGEQLRLDRARRRRLRRRAVLGAIVVASVTATIVVPPSPRLVWNASASAPVGLFSVSRNMALPVGTMVVAWPPRAAQTLADERHYLPRQVPLVKRIAAGPGDTVCALGRLIQIDGRTRATRQAHDRAGRTMPWWNGCHMLRNGQFLLMMADHPASFDGRYFGVSARSDIIGTAHPIWTR